MPKRTKLNRWLKFASNWKTTVEGKQEGFSFQNKKAERWAQPFI
jgi:hypothetical protein